MSEVEPPEIPVWARLSLRAWMLIALVAGLVAVTWFGHARLKSATPDEAPVKARQEIEYVNERGQEVDEADPAEPILLIGFSRVEHAHGRADQVAGDA